MAAAAVTAATTLEQQALEVASELSAALAVYQGANDGATPAGFSVTRTPNLNTGILSINISLPITSVVATDGGIDIDATEVLV